MEETKLPLKLQILTFVIYAANACFFPFQPVYFNSRSLSYTQIGIAFAAGALVSMLIQPVWGYLTDKYLDKRKTLFITMIASALVVIFFIKAGNFQSIMLLIIINSIFISAIYPILDAYTFDLLESKTNLSYSYFRFVASAAYAVTNLVLGYAVKLYGVDTLFIIFEVFAVAGVLVLCKIKFKGEKSLAKIQLGDIREALTDKKLVIFFVTIFLMYTASVGGVNYLNELLKFTGGDVSNLGMSWFTTCVFEVMTFYFTNRLIARFGVVNVYLASTLVYGLKMVLDFIFRAAVFIIAFQALEGIAFTLFITTSLQYLNMNTKPHIRASMMSIYAALGGLGSFVAGLAGGVILNWLNPSQLYAILGGLCFAACACSLGLRTDTVKSQI